MMFVIFISFTLSSITIINGVHFRGGMITWEPVSSVTNASPNITLLIHQRYAWSRSHIPCTQTNIFNRDLIGDYSFNPIVCLSSSTQCNSADYNSQRISSDVYCTDINLILGISSSSRSQSLSLRNNTKLVLAFKGNDSWLSLTYGSPAGEGWSLPVFIDLTLRPGIGINHSPTSTMPLRINIPIGILTSIEIPMSDNNVNDVIKCRWAKSAGTINGLSVDECAGACHSYTLPSTVQLRTFTKNRCQLNVTLPYVGYYIVALQIEDFSSNSSTIALSSVPLQFVLYGFDSYNTRTTCMTPPRITNMSPFPTSNGGNISVTVNGQYYGVIVAQTGCVNDTETYIANFITKSPSAMKTSSFPYAQNNTSQYSMELQWTPTIDQLGSTLTFCAIAIDVNDYSSDPFCVNFIVGPEITTTTDTTSTVTVTTTVTTSTLMIMTTSTTSTVVATTTATTSISTTETTTITTSQVVTAITSALSSDDGRILALGLGLGLPLILLISLLALSTIGAVNTTKSIACQTIESNNDKNQAFDRSIPDYRTQYVKKVKNFRNESSFNEQRRSPRDDSFIFESFSTFDPNGFNATTTSFLSFSAKNPSTNHVEYFGNLETNTNSLPTDSILSQAYSKQQAQKLP
ncbi:unnamed protein product [Rotaria sp. Silwood1]|nr:unnamed protein product [Rotaria sp. Silwood1]CAF3784809.1 unnamed protein product [Rotaria sp. Silwood1]CAF4907431.1 unnamed protein product [Rotaria sp. Silwood1]